MQTSHLPGDEVLTAEGPFVGRIATVVEIKSETALVTLSVFGRVVPLEMNLIHLLPRPDSGGGVGDPRVPTQPFGNPGSTAQVE
jgi:hypothetical protein